VLPPDYKGDVPDGYTAVRPATYNTMTLTTPADSTPR
jgi:hypothetical protein